MPNTQPESNTIEKAVLRPRILSGMRPTGKMHFGNHAGALANWIALQEEYQCFFFLADWHALTTSYEDPGRIREDAQEMVIDWLSMGLDPEKSVIFQQSAVKEHAELYLLLSMITPLGWLERVPTYKEQLRALSGREIATHGFLGYPVLQAADILCYRAQYVPVGLDQEAHLELSREIARRFNHLYGETFPEPQARFTPSPVVPGLDGRKMSKSYQNTIALSHTPEEVLANVANMFTDPLRVRLKDPGHPENCPVFTLHGLLEGAEEHEERARLCRGAEIGCAACKRALAESFNRLFEEPRARRQELSAHPEKVREILEEGNARARAVAAQTLALVRDRMGL